MSAFCGKCGKPLDGGRFCPACGADSAEAIPAATSGAANAGAAGAGDPMSRAASAGAAGAGVAAQAKSSNTLMIVLVIIVVIFGGIGAVVVYAAYWVKNKAVSTAKDYGVELPSDAHSRGRKSVSAASHRDPCSFLTAAEVAAATGVLAGAAVSMRPSPPAWPSPKHTQKTKPATLLRRTELARELLWSLNGGAEKS